MTDTKPPSAEALELVNAARARRGLMDAEIARDIDAFAERRAAEARRAAIEECADTCRALGHYSGSNVQPAIEQIADAIRALADKPAAGKDEP